MQGGLRVLIRQLEVLVEEGDKDVAMARFIVVAMAAQSLARELRERSQQGGRRENMLAEAVDHLTALGPPAELEGVRPLLPWMARGAPTDIEVGILAESTIAQPAAQRGHQNRTDKRGGHEGWIGNRHLVG